MDVMKEENMKAESRIGSESKSKDNLDSLVDEPKSNLYTQNPSLVSIIVVVLPIVATIGISYLTSDSLAKWSMVIGPTALILTKLCRLLWQAREKVIELEINMKLKMPVSTHDPFPPRRDDGS